MKNGASPEEWSYAQLKRANDRLHAPIVAEAARNQDQNCQQPSEGESMTLSQNNLQDMMLINPEAYGGRAHGGGAASLGRASRDDGKHADRSR